jgi:hypothetical protein
MVFAGSWEQKENEESASKVGWEAFTAAGHPPIIAHPQTNRRSERMLCAKSSVLGMIFLVVASGSTAIVSGQTETLPPPPGPIAVPPAGYRALTEADVQAGLARVRAVAAALDQRFATAGPSAEGWRTYLDWPALQAELQKAKPDQAVLNDVYKKLAAGYEGLELKWFADLRNVLGNYLFVASSAGNPDLEAAVKEHMTNLSNELKSLGDHPTTEKMRTIADNILWLQMARQDEAEVNQARADFDGPNFQVRIGKPLLDLGVGGPVDEVAPIDDVILGTVVHGTGHTMGQTSAALDADPNTAARFATFDAMLTAMNYSNNVGRNGPVCIYTTGQTCLAACKRFWIDAAGIHVYPAAANAQACTTINNIVSIKGRQLVENIAWKRAGKQKGQAEAIASQHAAAKLQQRVDAQANPPVQNANERYQAKVVKPLDERRAFPQLRFATLPDALEINARFGLDDQLAAPVRGGPPALTQPADLSACVHESAINNLAETVLAGVRLNDDMVQRLAMDLTGSVPDKLKPENNAEPFTIVFPPERIPGVTPVTVSFADGGFSVTLRGAEFYQGDRQQPGMFITANYKFTKTPDGYKAVRQGDLEIYGFGQKPGTKRAARQQGIYTALQTKFGKLFEPEIKFQGIKFAQGRLASAGQFVPQEIIAQNGWLVIGYGRTQSSSAPVAKN